MVKESTHRGDELASLGWSKEDVLRYEELWDYRQRWGAINLEREDRLFLRKAESALPKRVVGKASVRKSIQEKAYYRWLKLYLDAMDKAEMLFDFPEGGRGAWAILLEEELRVLEYYQPVLGLPDTLKAKAIDKLRMDIIDSLSTLNESKIYKFHFDFSQPLKENQNSNSKSWRPLLENSSANELNYLVLDDSLIEEYRLEVRSKIIPFIRNLLPSLVDCDKPEPPNEWAP